VNSSAAADSPRYHALLQLLRTADTLWNSSRLFFGRWQLSPSQFNVLHLLIDKPRGLSQIELGRLLIMHRSNVTGLVDRLEKRGLLQRKEVAADRRAYRIVLTPPGRKLVQQILPQYYRVAEEVWDGFPVHSAKQWATDLKRLGANAEKVTHAEP
jgi:DNA-binding MarR family transcriptional regulator